MKLPVAALAAFVIGVALMIPFEWTITRILGLAGMFFAIIAGVFSIATPELLSDDDDEDLPER